MPSLLSWVGKEPILPKKESLMSAVTRWIVAGVLCGLLVPPKWCCLQPSACSACCRADASTVFVLPSPQLSCCQTHSGDTAPSGPASAAAGCGRDGKRSHVPPPPAFPGGCCEPRLLLTVSPPAPRTGFDPFHGQWAAVVVHPWLAVAGTRSLEPSAWALPPLDTQILYGRWRN